MATPTLSHHSQPTSASKKPPGHASTPSHLGLSSPAPRSVPSPAATRKDHAGKTPINHPTTSSHGSKTVGGTPMVHNLSQQGHSQSPNANTLSFGTPVGLGVEGVTPGQLNMPTPALAGVPMSMSMSDLGIPSTTAGATQKRNEDDERRRRLRKILRSIGAPKGRVSEEGITRVSRRVGFDNDVDNPMHEDRNDPRKVGNRVISIAGKKIVVDISMKEQKAQSVTLMFDTQNPGLEAQAEGIGKVLLDDLQLHDPLEVPMQAGLERFAEDLERLAKVDGLSSPQINCFEALSGVYAGLKRLYEQEVVTSHELEVLKRKSGRPSTNGCGRVGLDLSYWQTKHSQLDDGEAKQPDPTFGLRLSVEKSSAGLYPSLRVSDNWLPDPLELASTDRQPEIPWQDPPPTLISESGEGDAMAVDGEQKLPDLRFVAKLDPPVVLPWQLASTTLQLFGLPAPQLFVFPTAWHSMLLNPASTTPFNATGVPPVTTEQTVLSKDGSDVAHSYTLDVPKPDGGHKLEALPFSHPRQLVELLPTLRQWACFGELVKQLFVSGASTKQSESASGAPMSLADLLTPPTTPPFANKVPISVSLATSPTPTLSFSFPTSGNGSLGNVCVQVLPNAELRVTSMAGLTDLEASDEARKKLTRALETCGDVGVWLEWLRGRAG